jgi:hypothetical protein
VPAIKNNIYYITTISIMTSKHNEHSLELTFKIAQGQTKHKADQVYGKPRLWSSHLSTRAGASSHSSTRACSHSSTGVGEHSSSLTFKHRGKGVFMQKHIQAQGQLIIQADSHSSTCSQLSIQAGSHSSTCSQSSMLTFKHMGKGSTSIGAHLRMVRVFFVGFL